MPEWRVDFIEEKQRVQKLWLAQEGSRNIDVEVWEKEEQKNRRKKSRGTNSVIIDPTIG